MTWVTAPHPAPGRHPPYDHALTAPPSLGPKKSTPLCVPFTPRRPALGPALRTAPCAGPALAARRVQGCSEQPPHVEAEPRGAGTRGPAGRPAAAAAGAATPALACGGSDERGWTGGDAAGRPAARCSPATSRPTCPAPAPAWPVMHADCNSPRPPPNSWRAPSCLGTIGSCSSRDHYGERGVSGSSVPGGEVAEPAGAGFPPAGLQGRPPEAPDTASNDHWFQASEWAVSAWGLALPRTSCDVGHTPSISEPQLRQL